MKLLPFFIAVIASTVHAASTVIDYDKVQPFAEPEPVTAAEIAAVKFKPQLKVADGCRPHPVVDADGAVSGGLLPDSRRHEVCTTESTSSQVYSRADWYDDKWAIMYAWYLPRNRGRPHGWVWSVVWIDDPALESSTVLRVSMPAVIGYHKHAPPKEKYLDGTSVELELYVNWVTSSSMRRLTEGEGEQQDLIQWDQLTEAARDSLSSFDFDESAWTMGDIECPLKDEVFTKKLKKASPF